jgi:tyrosyl-tRNA synthetase
MSKSYNNYIAFNDTPNDMYGKVLSIPDILIIKYFNLVTNLNYKEIKDYKFMLDAGKISHRDLKRKLGREIVSLYYDDKSASSAEQNFDNIFVNKGIPDNILEINISENIKIVDLIKKSNLVNSNSEIRRLIKQGAVKVDDFPISDIHYEIISKGTYIIKIGKRKFLRVNS